MLKDERLVCDLFHFINDVQVTSPTEGFAMAAGPTVTVRLSCCGIQDASQKLR